MAPRAVWYTALQAAYVRQRVLQTWAKLVEESCVPLNHWNILLAQGKERLSAAHRSTRCPTQSRTAKMNSWPSLATRVYVGRG
jgi:hypothetical protein